MKASLQQVLSEPPSLHPALFQGIGLWWVWCRWALGSGVQLMAFLLSHLAQSVHAESSSAEALEMPTPLNAEQRMCSKSTYFAVPCWAALSITTLWDCARATPQGRQRRPLNICLCIHLLENQKSLMKLQHLSWCSCQHVQHFSIGINELCKIANGSPHLKYRENGVDFHVVLPRPACASQRQNQAFETGFLLKPFPFPWSITAFL